MLQDEEALENADAVERLILCSGKIYTELAGSEYREEAVDTAIARIELLYPFPEDEVEEVVDSYPNLREILWVQEEPKNMGAWTFVQARLEEAIGEDLPVRYIGKPARPSPAQGSARFHKEEHAQMIQRAFESVSDDADEGREMAQATQEQAPTGTE